MKNLISLFFCCSFLSLSSFNSTEDYSGLFIGTWKMTKSVKAFNGQYYNNYYTLKIERQDKESLKWVITSEITINDSSLPTSGSNIIYKKSETTYTTNDNKLTFAYNKATGNIELNGNVFIKIKENRESLVGSNISNENSDNISELFIGTWKMTKSVRAFNGQYYNNYYTLKIERQDKESLKWIISSEITINDSSLPTSGGNIIYKKSETTYTTNDNQQTFAYNKVTGNIELNGYAFTKGRENKDLESRNGVSTNKPLYDDKLVKKTQVNSYFNGHFKCSWKKEEFTYDYKSDGTFISSDGKKSVTGTWELLNNPSSDDFMIKLNFNRVIGKEVIYPLLEVDDKHYKVKLTIGGTYTCEKE